jgi:uncharacterized membrane protein YphA (DoxX/SURF4 family)
MEVIYKQEQIVMKIAALIARILLGAVFVFFGLNMILQFMHAPMPTGDAGALMGLMFTHKWVAFYGFVEAAAGAMLLFGRFVPLGLTLLAGILVNILLYHLTLDPPGIGPGLIAGVLEAFLVYAYRASFAGLFDPRAQSE